MYSSDQRICAEVILGGAVATAVESSGATVTAVHPAFRLSLIHVDETGKILVLIPMQGEAMADDWAAKHYKYDDESYFWNQ